MADLFRSNPTGRFTGLAEIYAKSRPGYPESAIDYIMARCHLSRGATLVDVGCGTGISSRLFASRGLQVIGIEPNADMRNQAAQEIDSPHVPPEYLSGQAESTGLKDGTAEAVLLAQAFHWFEPEATLKEFHRILKKDGFVVVMYNGRDATDSMTRQYGEVLALSEESRSLESSTRADTSNSLFESALFQKVEQESFANEQVLDEEGLIARASSASYAPRAGQQRDIFVDCLCKLFMQYQESGFVRLKYQTLVKLASKVS